MTVHALNLLRVLRRWATGSVHKFAEELNMEPFMLRQAVLELKSLEFVVEYPMKDSSAFKNAMLEITQEGLDFIEKHDGEIDSQAEEGETSLPS